MEDDDPVIQEIPVYLSQALTEHLYIYQYPVKPANREWKNAKVVKAFVKPKNQLVKLEVALDTYSEKYCPSKGEQIALNTDGQPESSRYVKDKEREKSLYFKTGIMDKVVYESSRPILDTHHYAVAVYQDKELHCTPVKGILQLRPSYSYFDKQDKRKKDSDKEEKSDDEEENEAQQVTVKFARQETEVAKKAREKSYDFISKRTSEEPWYEAQYKHDDTDYAELERLKLFCATSGASGMDSQLGGLGGHGVCAARYARALVPRADDDAAAPAAGAEPSLLERCRRLLLQAKMMSFWEVRALVGGGVPEAALAAALAGAGCCVRGAWCARSADVFAAASGAAGVPAALMCAARDHVLYLFTRQQRVSRRALAAAARLPAREALEVLRSVARRAGGAWRALVPPDAAFEDKFPEVVQRQNLYWEAKQRQFNEMLIGESIPKRQRKKSQRDSFSSEQLLSPKPRCSSVSEEDGEKKRCKNKCSNGGGKRTRQFSSSSAHDGAS